MARSRGISMAGNRFSRRFARVCTVVVAVLLAVYGLAPVAAHADSTAGVFVPTQGRVVDTRSGLGGYSNPLAVGTTRTFQITGLAGVPTSGVTAVSVTLDGPRGHVQRRA